MKNSKFLYSPIFISGFNKSGTTLLLSLLDSHRQLVTIPEELHYFRNALFAKDKFNSILKNTGFKAFLSDEYLKEWSKGKSLYKYGYPDFDKKTFYEELIIAIRENNNPIDLLLRLVLSFARIAEKKIDHKKHWVTKTTQNEIFFPLLDYLFGNNLVFLYLVRDPRDVFISYKKRKEIISKNNDNKILELFLVNWKIQVNKALKYNKKYDNFFIIKYENLVSNPVKEMLKIAKLINIEYSDILIKPTRLSQSWEGNSVFENNLKGIDKSTIGRYKKLLGFEELTKIETCLKNEMSALGYDFTKKKKMSGNSYFKFNLIYRISDFLYNSKQKIITTKYKILFK